MCENYLFFPPARIRPIKDPEQNQKLSTDCKRHITQTTKAKDK
jgi:hypothetical protein